MKYSSPRLFTSRTFACAGFVTVSFWLLLCSPVSATLLDDFNDNIKTAWTDNLNGGSATEALTVFTINSSASPGALTSSKKTSALFTTASGHTIEIRANVNSITPDGSGHAVVGWVP